MRAQRFAANATPNQTEPRPLGSGPSPCESTLFPMGNSRTTDARVKACLALTARLRSRLGWAWRGEAS